MAGGEVGVDVPVELAQQGRELQLGQPLLVRHAHLDHLGPRGPQPCRRTGHQGVHLGAERRQSPQADPLAAQAAGAGERVRGVPPAVVADGVVTAEHGEGERGVDHVAGHGPRRVLFGGDRHDPRLADQPETRLVADHPVHPGRAHDGAVRLGADRHLRQRRGQRRGRTGGRATGVAVQHVRVVRLAAHRRPSRGRPRRAEVGPLGHVGLAEDHRARRPQPLDQVGVRVGRAARQRQGPGGRRHVAGVDVVLEEDRDAVERAAGPAEPVPEIAGGRLAQGRRAGAQHRVELGVDGLDPPQVRAGQRGRGQRAAVHAGL